MYTHRYSYIYIFEISRSLIEELQHHSFNRAISTSVCSAITIIAAQSELSLGRIQGVFCAMWNPRWRTRHASRGGRALAPAAPPAASRRVLRAQAARRRTIARFPVLNFSSVCRLKDLIFASGFCDFKFLAFCGFDTSVFWFDFSLGLLESNPEPVGSNGNFRLLFPVTEWISGMSYC